MWESKWGWETENESFDTWVKSWVGELESWNRVIVEIWDREMQRIDQRWRQWVAEAVRLCLREWVYERGETESKEWEKEWMREFRIFCLKLKFKRCVLHLFFFFLLEFWPKLAGIGAGTAWIGLFRPKSACFDSFSQYDPIWAESVQIGLSRHRVNANQRVSENQKKKSSQHRRAGSGITYHTPHRAASDVGAFLNNLISQQTLLVFMQTAVKNTSWFLHSS